jgi:hypothetical protein
MGRVVIRALSSTEEDVINDEPEEHRRQHKTKFEQQHRSSAFSHLTIIEHCVHFVKALYGACEVKT